MTELNKIESIIIRSLDKTASHGELTELNQWLTASPENKTEYFRIKDVWDTLSDGGREDPQKAWLQFHKKAKHPRSLLNVSREILKIAAVAIVAFTVGYLVFEKPFAPSEMRYATVNVPNGSKGSVQLPDGSTVILNAGSQLIYPSDFEKSIRQVQLQGEGYFKVAHNEEHPFVIKANEVEVKVLGTEFNLMAYQGDKRVETTLVTGKVWLNQKSAATDCGVTLKPGQKAIYSHGKIKVEEADVELVTQWMQDGFVFRNTSFVNLMGRLERWHNVKIMVDADDFKDITFTGKFRNHETIWQVLDAIKLTTPMLYKTRDDTIYIELSKKQ